MPLPPNLERAARESEDALTAMMDAYDRQLFASIQDIEREILRLLRDLELNPAGNILKTSANLQRAINAWYAMTRFAQQEIAELSDRWTAQFEPVAQFVQANMAASGIPVAFTAVDERLIQVMRDIATIDLNSGVNFVYRDLGRTLTSEVLVGGNFNNLVKAIQAKLLADLLAGTIELAVGQSLGNVSTRIAHDSLMNLYASLHWKKAEDAGIERFLYLGSRVRDSRPFCLERKMKIFTKAEIHSWNNLNWKGKTPGVPVEIQRGGYRCIDHFQAVPSAISAEDLGLAA